MNFTSVTCLRYIFHDRKKKKVTEQRFSIWQLNRFKDAKNQNKIVAPKSTNKGTFIRGVNIPRCNIHKPKNQSSGMTPYSLVGRNYCFGGAEIIFYLDDGGSRFL
jgi:hypothetical protein